MELKQIRAEYLGLFEGKTIVSQEQLLNWHAGFIAALEKSIKSENQNDLAYLSEIGFCLLRDKLPEGIDLMFENLHGNLHKQRQAAYQIRSGYSALNHLSHRVYLLAAAFVDFESKLSEWNETELQGIWDSLELDTTQAEQAACNGLRATFIQSLPGINLSREKKQTDAYIHAWLEDSTKDLLILDLPSPLVLARIVGDLALYGWNNGLLALLDYRPSDLEIPVFIESIIAGLVNMDGLAFASASLNQMKNRLDAAESLLVDFIYGEKAEYPRWVRGEFAGSIGIFSGGTKHDFPARASRDDAPIPTIFASDAMEVVAPMVVLVAQKLHPTGKLDEKRWQSERAELPPFMQKVMDMFLEAGLDNGAAPYGTDLKGRIHWLFSLCKDEVSVVASILKVWFDFLGDPSYLLFRLLSPGDISARFRQAALDASAHAVPDPALREFVRHIANGGMQPYETMIKLLAVIRHALGASAALKQVPISMDEETVADCKLLEELLKQPGRILAESRSLYVAVARLQEKSRNAKSSFTTAEDEGFARLEAQYREARDRLIGASKG